METKGLEFKVDISEERINEFLASEIIVINERQFIAREKVQSMLTQFGIECVSDYSKQLQSDKQTVLEALKEAREALYGLVFVTSDQHLTNEASLEEAEKAVKKYDKIIKANT